MAAPRGSALSLAMVAAGLLALAAAAPPRPPCPKCDTAACPEGAAHCAHGLGPDPCGCCVRGLCGLGPGFKCFAPGLPLSAAYAAAVRAAPCGQGLACEMRQDLRPADEPEALCVCQDPQPACGSDNRTYDTGCDLAAAAGRKGRGPHGLVLKHLGPCASAPWVISGPTDVHSPLHTSLALDCEVKGYPTPSITWEFKGDDGTSRVLPSDDLYVAVQVRGGPESFMATSWVQIVDLRPSDTGMYTCVASNSEGSASASAVVSAR